MASASVSSLSTEQFIYLYTASVIPLISMKIYFKLDAKILQGNAAVLSILHSLKELISSGRNFHRTMAGAQINLKIFILKFSRSGSFFSQKSIFESVNCNPCFFSGGCVDEVGNWTSYHGYTDDVYFLEYHTSAAIRFMNHEGLWSNYQNYF